MKKIIFVLMTLLVTSPVFAAGVTITLTERLPDANVNDPCKVVLVSYINTEPQHVRAFGLNINLKAGADANITGVKCGNTDYAIYPGSIVIDSQGVITSPGSCLCNRLHAGTPPSKAVTIEMGSLGVVPADSGVLAEITINGYGTVDVNTTLNAIRGGIVMYDGSPGSTMGSIQLVLPNRPVTDCVKNIVGSFYADWVTWGKPDCWCFRKQCYGDINGSSYLGKPVTTTDLNILKLVFNQVDAVVQATAGGICADLNHAAYLGKRVTTTDLNIFKTYFNVVEASGPECDQAPVISGPYNFWTN